MDGQEARLLLAGLALHALLTRDPLDIDVAVEDATAYADALLYRLQQTAPRDDDDTTL